MINLWDYQNEKKIKLIDVDDYEYIGFIDEITDAEEYADNETNEDGITLNIDGKLVEFMQSEIKSIEKID